MKYEISQFITIEDRLKKFKKHNWNMEESFIHHESDFILFPINTPIPIISTADRMCIGMGYVISMTISEKGTSIEFKISKLFDTADDVTIANWVYNNYLQTIGSAEPDEDFSDQSYVPGVKGLGMVDSDDIDEIENEYGDYDDPGKMYRPIFKPDKRYW